MIVFFFKQKTAYEMRISDWSSDVCSSDLAERFIFLVYDERYHAAGLFLSILLVGSWFGILSTMADAMMMGVGKPSGVAFSNGAKLAVIAVALPLLLPRYGMNAALLVFVLADAVRYAMLAWLKRGGGLRSEERRVGKGGVSKGRARG